MKLGSFKRMMKTDFPQEQHDLVEKLGFTINSSFENVYNTLNNNVTLSENVACTVKQIEVEVDSTGKPKQTVGFSINFPGRVSIVQVGRAENLTNSTVYPTGAPFVSFQQSDKTILINHVTGLQANYRYRLTLVAFKE